MSPQIKTHNNSDELFFLRIVPFLFPVIISCLVAFAILEVPWISDFVGLRTAGLIALATLVVSLTFMRDDFVGIRIYFYLGGIIWFFLLLGEFVMTRKTLIGEAQGGNFSYAVTGLIVIWLFLSSWVAILSLWNPIYMKEFFSERIFLLSLFATMAMLSATYSDSPLYSLAWAFKLCLAITAITIWSYGINNMRELKQALKIVWMTYFILSCVPLTQVIGDNIDLFSGGRFGGAFSPTGISRVGGTLFLLSILWLTLAHEKKIKYQVSLMYGLVIMGLGVGKTAMLSCLIAVMVFLILTGKLRTSLWLAIGIIGFGVLAILLKLPMVNYLINYHQQETGLTLTGRMDLWQASLPRILENIWIGSGYVSSKFSSLDLEGVHWDAGHLHNAFLDVLYNNGLVGLGLVILMNYKLIKTLFRVIQRAKYREEFYVIGVGLLSLYLFMFMNAFAYVPFGGRPHNQFILFLTLYVFAHKLCDLLENRTSKSL